MDVQLPLLGIEMPARSKNKKKTINVFFAIFLTVETAVPVTRLALEQRKKHAFKGPIVEAENLHVSLINLGERKKLPDWVIDKARQAAASVMVPPFELAFDRVASFSGEDGNRPLVLCGSKENAAMKALYAALAEALKAAHLIRQDDGTFTPHLTLLYDKFIDKEHIKTVRWTVQEFVLVSNREKESGYERLGSWPLRG